MRITWRYRYFAETEHANQQWVFLPVLADLP